MKTYVVLFALAACGDNGLPHATTDASTTTDGSSVDAGSPTPRAIAVAGDYTTPPGVLSSLDIHSLKMSTNLKQGTVTDDPVIRHAGDRLLIINRDTNNVTILNAADLSLVTQIAIGPNSDPQDAVIVGNNVYVPALHTSGVVIGHLDGASATTLDLHTATGDTDGKPNCDGAIAVGTDVYVTCGNLDDTNVNLPAKTVGKIVVIDTTTNTVRTTIDMPVKNPTGNIVAYGTTALFMPTYGATDGCTVKVTTGATPTATCEFMNSTLNTNGGTMQSLDINGALLIFGYSDGFFTGSWARTYDTVAHTLGANLTPDTQAIHDVALCPEGQIAVTEGQFGAAGGIRVYNNTTELTTDAISIGIAPSFGGGLICY
ncbi:MAG: hypothetical protein QM831_16730 [Kofleriaceae bacterium]